MLLIWCAGGGDIGTLLLSARPVVALGLISYSLYLWHQPLFAFARIHAVDDVQQQTYLALMAAAILLAAASYRWIEQPFRASLVPRRPLILTTASLSVLLIAAGITGHAARGFPGRMPLTAAAAKVDTGYVNLAGEDCGAVCIVGDRRVAPTIALVGDSHAAALSRSLDVRLQNTGVSIMVLAGGDMYVSRFPRFYALSDQLNATLAERNRILASPAIKTVILAGRHTLRIENTAFDNGEGAVERLGESYVGRSEDEKAAVLGAIGGGIAQLRRQGKEVVLVYPVPEAGWVVPDTLVKLERRGERRDLTVAEALYRQRNQRIIALFDSLHGPDLRRVRTDKIFCGAFTPARCALNIGDRILYADDDHLSVEGADLVADEVVRQLGLSGANTTAPAAGGS
jgi:hypothetical protein